MKSDNFKLIAIRPLKDCSQKFAKNLTKGTIYKFYKDYVFYDVDRNEIEEESPKEVSFVKHDSKVPDNLYRIENNENSIDINISALVGKNGSGKSTLLELLYASCYVIASKKEILNSVSRIHRKFKKNNQTLSEKDNKELEDIQTVYNNLDVELFYSINEIVFCIKLSHHMIYHYVVSGKDSRFNEKGFYESEENLEYNLKFVLNELFFYTISINYSLYGLNNKYLGNWVKALFHKNDGYQTPLVINPFRDNGNIDVNSELHLAQTRLLTNIINTPINKLVNDKSIDTVVFELEKNKYNERVDNDINELYSKFKSNRKQSDVTFFKDIYNRMYSVNIDSELKNVPNEGYQCRYIFRKILKISQSYSEYKDLNIIDVEAKEIIYDNFYTLLSELRDDRSHITLKIRQVLNNIRFDILYNSERDIWKKNREHEWVDNNDGNKYYTIKLSELIERIKSYKRYTNASYEELIPIGCFNPVLWVKNSKDDNSINNIDVLSSGEQHFIHSIQSILYHLININSVFESKASKIKYNYVNIVLDEIELYYHPEYQRVFVSELLEKIQSLSIPNIKGINILFCTHSPFILSDIPKENTLKLENGDVKFDVDTHNTLGANIHDLLDNDFYLQKGFMGEYTKDKIFSLINFLDEEIKEKHKTKFNHKWSKVDALNFIELIGEPVLKSTLKELYFSKFNNDLDKEIERLNNLKNMIN